MVIDPEKNETELETQRLRSAYVRAQQLLLEQRVEQGHWVGELSGSALSTATAVSALSYGIAAASWEPGMACEAKRQIAGGLAWLVESQNEDGGWGDTELSYSNISTSMLVVAAIDPSGDAAPAAADSDSVEPLPGSGALPVETAAVKEVAGEAEDAIPADRSSQPRTRQDGRLRAGLSIRPASISTPAMGSLESDRNHRIAGVRFGTRAAQKFPDCLALLSVLRRTLGWKTISGARNKPACCQSREEPKS